jgi:predicted Zn-dependent protease with MMP-like domain
VSDGDHVHTSGDLAEGDARGTQRLTEGAVDFEQAVRDALDSLPGELRTSMSNVEILIEDEPPGGMPLLGLYQGVPLTQRGAFYAGTLPDKITVYRAPLERLYGDNEDELRHQIRRVVLHEVAHHFGISDERLVELDRY